MKYALPRFGSMADISRSKYASGLILTVSAITGWKIPIDDTVKRLLIEQLSKYFEESAKDMNPDEVGYAVRKYGKTVTDWGKSLNILLIDECICQYRTERDAISEEERRASQTQGVAEKDVLPSGPIDWSSLWEVCLESAKNGELSKIIISSALFDWLEREKLANLSDEEKKDILYDVTWDYVVELENCVLNNVPNLEPLQEVKRRLNLLKRNKRAWKDDAAINARLINLAKIESVRRIAIKQSKVI